MTNRVSVGPGPKARCDPEELAQKGFGDLSQWGRARRPGVTR